MKLLPSLRVPCTPYNHAPCHFMQNHIRKVYACLAVTCHLHFWQNDRGLLRATAATRGWNGYRNKSQHTKLTLEKKILPPLQQGFEPATFRSRLRRSNHWAIPAQHLSSQPFYLTSIAVVLCRLVGLERSTLSCKPRLFFHALSIWPQRDTVLTGGLEVSALLYFFIIYFSPFFLIYFFLLRRLFFFFSLTSFRSDVTTMTVVLCWLVD